MGLVNRILSPPGFAEGSNNLAEVGYGFAVGLNSFAEGSNNPAETGYGFAEGSNNPAEAVYGLAEASNSLAEASNSRAVGFARLFRALI